LTIRGPEDAPREKVIRKLLTGLRIGRVEGYPADSGGTRTLTFPVSGGPRRVAALSRRVLREVYGVTDEDGLNFTYQEGR
jgi:hypothetical protein